MRRTRPVLIAAVTIGLLVPSTAAAASPPHFTHFTPGAAGSGDPSFPDMGTGGYDVGHYDIDLAFDPATKAISATTTIQARATQNLSRFALCFLGPWTVRRG